MIAENFILKSWNEQQKIFIDNLLAIRERPTRKAVHDLRVSVKKIRSYLRLRNLISCEAWKKEFSPVKTIFRISGKQRDFEMSLSLLSKYQRKEKLMLPLFKRFLQINKSFTHQLTKKIMLDFNVEQFQLFSNSACISLSLLTDAELTNKINEYAEEVMQKADKQTKKINENAHEVRKEFKDLYYWLIASIPNSAPGIINIKLVDKILKQLGNWQDNFIFLKKLKKFKKEFLVNNTNEAEAAAILEMKISNNKDELLNKAKKLLKAAIKKRPEN